MKPKFTRKEARDKACENKNRLDEKREKNLELMLNEAFKKEDFVELLSDVEATIQNYIELGLGEISLSSKYLGDYKSEVAKFYRDAGYEVFVHVENIRIFWV